MELVPEVVKVLGEVRLVEASFCLDVRALLLMFHGRIDGHYVQACLALVLHSHSCSGFVLFAREPVSDVLELSGVQFSAFRRRHRHRRWQWLTLLLLHHLQETLFVASW
jgi:hypothetical protein